MNLLHFSITAIHLWFEVWISKHTPKLVVGSFSVLHFPSRLRWRKYKDYFGGGRAMCSVLGIGPFITGYGQAMWFIREGKTAYIIP